VGTVWAASVRRSLDDALQLLSAVVQDCPDELWRTPMWRVQASEIAGEVYDDGGSALTDRAQRDARIQRWSQPWSVAWHALEVLDYDLAGELDTWTPPPPFANNPHWRTFTVHVAWSQAEIAGYIDHCRQRVTESFRDMTEDKAATPLPGGAPLRGYALRVDRHRSHRTHHRPRHPDPAVHDLAMSGVRPPGLTFLRRLGTDHLQIGLLPWANRRFDPSAPGVTSVERTTERVPTSGRDGLSDPPADREGCFA
jgi:hypothetical protein